MQEQEDRPYYVSRSSRSASQLGLAPILLLAHTSSNCSLPSPHASPSQPPSPGLLTLMNRHRIKRTTNSGAESPPAGPCRASARRSCCPGESETGRQKEGGQRKRGPNAHAHADARCQPQT